MSDKAVTRHSELHGLDAEEEVPSHARISPKTLLLLFSVNLIYFTQLVNIVGSGVLTRSITAVVGGNSTDGVWFTQTIAILTAVLGIPVSQGADLWGRKVFLVYLTAFGSIGGIIVAKASSMNMAIAGFTITGISYGAQPLLLAVTSEVLARKYRPWAQASINVASAFGAITGLLVGGAWTRNDPANFRNYWYLVTGIYAFTAAVCQLLYNPPPRPLQLQLSTRDKVGRLDWVGYALLAPSLVLICMALTWSQNPYEWTDPHVLAPFLVGISLAAILILYEIYGVRDGMFHHDLFHHRNFPIALGCIFAEGLIFFCANGYFAFEVSILFATDTLLTGVHYAIGFMSFAVFSLAAGLWCSRTRTVQLPSAAAFAFFMLFCILMATVSRPRTTVAQIWGFPVFLGAGLGICLTALVTAAHFATPYELVAITSGLLISVRSLGGSIGLALFNAIFSNGLSKMGSNIAHAVVPLGFPASGLPDLIPALVNHDAEALGKIREASPNIVAAGYGALEKTYLISFRHVWIAAGCFSSIAVIACFFLQNPTEEFTSQVDAPVDLVQSSEKSETV
ncbi:siderophore iron transporter [Fusarium mexicanum]|uniref:Siderophore iron transporter n=1 Tax=Fusarium mexicanum TaxID=751941 RepID=A0A8H5IEE4_9HYPO|nr:siderophore iron transporter [Fusarium mexicanum]